MPVCRRQRQEGYRKPKDKPGPHTEYQFSLRYRVRPCSKKSRDNYEGTSYENSEYSSLPSCVTETIEQVVVSPVIDELQGVEREERELRLSLHDPSNLHLLEKHSLPSLSEAGLGIDLGEMAG